MAIPAGLGGQLGFVAEVTYGTYVAPTRFLEFRTESLKADVRQIESMGIGRGAVLRSDRIKSYIAGASGSIELPVMTKGMGLIFKHMLGSFSAAQQNSTAEYLHTSSVDASRKTGLMLTTQIGRPSIAGTVHPFNYEGCKIVGWELKCAIDEPLILNLDIDAETEQTSDALASASYASSDDFHIFTQGAATIGGSSVKIRGFSLKGVEGLDTDRRFIGGTKLEPLGNAEQVITAALDFEFESLTRHAALTAGTIISNLILTFDTGLAIPSGNGSNFKLTITVPKLIYTGPSGPNIGGPAILRDPMDAKVLYDGSTSPVTITQYTTDTAA